MSSLWALCWRSFVFYRLCNLSFAHRNYKCDWNFWQNLMHFTSISRHFTFFRKKNGTYFCRKRMREEKKASFCCGPSFLFVLLLFLSLYVRLYVEKVSCRSEDSVVWFHTELYTMGRVWINKKQLCLCGSIFILQLSWYNLRVNTWNSHKQSV